MTNLRKRMLEELQRRNYCESTIRGYLRAVEQFAGHFGKSPDKLGPDELRSYRAYLLTERKLAVGSVVARVLAPVLPTCAAQRLRPHPPLRLSRQRPPHLSPRARSAAARLPAPTKFTSHQLPDGHLAVPALRSQHEHRAQPHRATTGVSMQADRLLLMPAPSKGSRRCDRTSRPTCVFSAKLRPNNQFLHARSSRNHSSLRGLSPLPPYPARVFQPLCPIHRSQFSPLAP